jgi:hypothetical protein
MNGDRADGFLSRWAWRKEQVRSGEAVAAEASAPAPLPAAPAPAVVPAVAVVEVHAAVSEKPAETPAEPLPTMADVALLTRESDYSRFVAPGIDDGVKRAAMKKLFSDPHFNVMDGLDTYIDDYGKPDPIPLTMLRQMNQAKFLRLFDDDEEDDEAEAATKPGLASSTRLTEAPIELPIEPNSDLSNDSDIDPNTDPKPRPDDDPDLRLQQDDADRRTRPDQGLGA